MPLQHEVHHSATTDNRLFAFSFFCAFFLLLLVSSSLLVVFLALFVRRNTLMGHLSHFLLNGDPFFFSLNATTAPISSSSSMSSVTFHYHSVILRQHFAAHLVKIKTFSSRPPLPSILYRHKNQDKAMTKARM